MSASRITVLYFAQVAELTAKRSEIWSIETPCSVDDWLTQLISHYPTLAPIKKRLKVAINQYHVEHNALIQSGDEVAVFEPVTGG